MTWGSPPESAICKEKVLLSLGGCLYCPPTHWQDATAGVTLLSPYTPSSKGHNRPGMGRWGHPAALGQKAMGYFIGSRDILAAPCHQPTFRNVVLVGSSLELHSTCRQEGCYWHPRKPGAKQKLSTCATTGPQHSSSKSHLSQETGH